MHINDAIIPETKHYATENSLQTNKQRATFIVILFYYTSGIGTRTEALLVR